MATSTEVVKAPPVGLKVREGFGERELLMQTERAAIAQAAKAKAEVEARFSMAMLNRRDMDDVRARLLKDCDRPEFAKAARYKVPNRGEGFTIRFAEAAAAHMGNMFVSAPCIVEDEYQRTICVTVMDLERNLTWTKDVVILKTIERKDTAGREVIRYRTKADGSNIAIVRATDEELLTKENSLVSKAARTGIERLIPPDLKSECLKAVTETIASRDTKDPDGARKEIADAFLALGVMPSHLKEYLGCELAQVAPAEMVTLRELYVAIREGHTTWREVMAAKRAESGEEEEGAGKKADALKEKLRASKKSEAPAGKTADATKPAAEGKKEPERAADAVPVEEEPAVAQTTTKSSDEPKAGLSPDDFSAEEFKNISFVLTTSKVAINRKAIIDRMSDWKSGRDNFMSNVRDLAVEHKIAVNWKD